jgi:hypothetical protein
MRSLGSRTAPCKRGDKTAHCQEFSKERFSLAAGEGIFSLNAEIARSPHCMSPRVADGRLGEAIEPSRSEADTGAGAEWRAA